MQLTVLYHIETFVFYCVFIFYSLKSTDRDNPVHFEGSANFKIFSRIEHLDRNNGFHDRRDKLKKL